MYKIAFLFAILASAQAQLISNGKCDFSNLQRTITKDFAVFNNYFEIKRISNTWFTGHCVSLSFIVNNETKTANITLKEVLNRKIIEREMTFNPSEIQEDYYNVVFKDFNSNFTYLGLGDKYAILYACSNVEQGKQEYAWVLSPNTTLTEYDKNATDTVIINNKLNTATWVETSHSAEACNSGPSIMKLSPITFLIFGFLVSKGL